MVTYLGLIQAKTYEIRREIKDLNEKLEDKKREITKEYFQIGKRAIYEDSRDGYIEGEIVKVDDFNVTVKVDCVNGDRSDGLCRVKTFEANELNLL